MIKMKNILWLKLLMINNDHNLFQYQPVVYNNHHKHQRLVNVLVVVVVVNQYLHLHHKLDLVQ